MQIYDQSSIYPNPFINNFIFFKIREENSVSKYLKLRSIEVLRSIN